MIPGLYRCFDHWHQTGTVFLYSDTHFNDENLETNHPRPYTTEEHIKRINSKVGRKDTLILLGDVGDISMVPKLRGYKILICGNHDSGYTNYLRKQHTITYSKVEYERDEALAKAKELYPTCSFTIVNKNDVWEITVDNKLFDEVYEGPLVIGEKLILSHEPVDVPWAFNIHGHIHDSKRKNDKFHFNVCADVIGYLPINMNQWMKEGYLARVESIHRTTINSATIKKAKRDGKKIGQR